VLTALKLHILLSLSPLETAVLVGLILGERLTPAQLIGMSTVVLGVSLVQWRKGRVETLNHSPFRVTIQTIATAPGEESFPLTYLPSSGG
jgi:hypothetical protein